MNRFTWFTVWIMFAAANCPGQDTAPARFKDLPKPWSIEKTVVVPEGQLAAFSRKLGGQVTHVSNTTLAVNGQTLKVNEVRCQTREDASQVRDALLRAHQDNAMYCPLDGLTIVEFVTNDPALVERAYDELKIPRPSVTYLLEFQAAPIESCDYMVWNKMFNAFLAAQPDDKLIGDLATRFKFSDRIALRNHGLGNEPSSISLEPAPLEKSADANRDTTTFVLGERPRRRRIPMTAIAMTVTSTAFAPTAAPRAAAAELVGPNEFWPSSDPAIVALAGKITADQKTPRDKVAAILRWLKPGANLRYAGDVTGSRYGVKKVFEQRHGHCWDFSDCFVTLCRASGVPSRQVVGWLHGQSGHVWAEVLVDGTNWRQVDPTAAMGCDCRYIPLVASEDGRMPYVYTSPIRISVKRR